MTSATATEPAARPAPTAADVAVVAIGRNEGERLRRCFDALPAGCRRVVYVDSSSTDGSVELARGRGVGVVALDLSVPFTAARARNAGLRCVRERWPDVEYVLFLDGDCALAPGFVERALAEAAAHPDLAVVCGRRRELRPAASIYNALCDLEWDTPIGEALSSGGDALVRTAALVQAGSYDDRLIAGEEPELCARLRAAGWRIWRLDHEMTLHDAAMTRFGQWWRRSVRAGHAFAEVHALHPELWGREVRSLWCWGLGVPAAAILTAPWTGGAGLLLLGAYPALWARIVARRARRDGWRLAALYATFCVIGKFSEAAGAFTFRWNRWRGDRTRLIEYK